MGKLIMGFVVMLILGYSSYTYLSHAAARSQCQEEALEWTQNSGLWLSNLQTTSNKEFAATKLARLKLMCPNGHISMKDSFIPNDVKLLSENEFIIDAAKESINIK